MTLKLPEPARQTHIGPSGADSAPRWSSCPRSTNRWCFPASGRIWAAKIDEQVVLVVEVHGSNHLRLRREHVPDTETRDRGLLVHGLVGSRSSRDRTAGQIAGQRVVGSHLGLHRGACGQLRLHERVEDVAVLAVVLAKADRVVVELADAEGQLVPDPGDRGLVAETLSFPATPLNCAATRLRLNSGLNSLKPGSSGPARSRMNRSVSARCGGTGVRLIGCSSCA